MSVTTNQEIATFVFIFLHLHPQQNEAVMVSHILDTNIFE